MYPQQEEKVVAHNPPQPPTRGPFRLWVWGEAEKVQFIFPSTKKFQPIE